MNWTCRFLKKTVQMRTSFGCPFSCAFCSYPQVSKGLRIASDQMLERAMQRLSSLSEVQHVVFIDDTFNFPPERFKRLCRILSRHHKHWYCFLRSQFIDDETARLMSDSGCQAVYLGIESANDTVLANMNKKATRVAFEQGVASLRAHGIASMAAFVLGFPGETQASLKDNMDFIENTGVEDYTLKEFYYMENTPVHRDRAKYGLKGAGHRWEHATMTSREASEHKLQLFRGIKGSTFVDPDTSLWYLVLMRENGYSFSEITTIQTVINGVINDQTNGHFSDDHPAFVRLRSLIGSRGGGNEFAGTADSH